MNAAGADDGPVALAISQSRQDANKGRKGASVGGFAAGNTAFISKSCAAAGGWGVGVGGGRSFYPGIFFFF